MINFNTLDRDNVLQGLLNSIFCILSTENKVEKRNRNACISRNRGRHLKASSDFSKKVPYYQKFLEHLPYINCVPISEFSLENVKIKMKLVVKYNLLKYADNEEKSQTNKSSKIS